MQDTLGGQPMPWSITMEPNCAHHLTPSSCIPCSKVTPGKRWRVLPSTGQATKVGTRTKPVPDQPRWRSPP